ncbi:hypothetical protein [Ventosimonas gracilis]|nr:hypothetical protein [Ventosimonas gracilis]
MKNMLMDAHGEVLRAIELHKNGDKAPLSPAILNNVKRELEDMMEAMDPKIYVPSYSRPIMDWPEEDETGIVKRLVHVSFDYDRIRK